MMVRCLQNSCTVWHWQHQPVVEEGGLKMPVDDVHIIPAVHLIPFCYQTAVAACFLPMLWLLCGVLIATEAYKKATHHDARDERATEG